MEDNPAIFATSLNLQLEELIRRPVIASQTSFQDSICCIVVDGLDEYGSDENQSKVIHLLRDLVSDPEPPFCVVVSSRPEFPIRPALGRALSDVAYHLEQDRTYDPEEDIERFVGEELRRIQETLLLQVPASSWPSRTHVLTIRNKSNRYYDPRARLHISKFSVGREASLP